MILGNVDFGLHIFSKARGYTLCGSPYKNNRIRDTRRKFNRRFRRKDVGNETFIEIPGCAQGFARGPHTVFLFIHDKPQKL